MLEASKISHYHHGDPVLDVVLNYDERKKSRYRTRTTCGRDLGWFLERGVVLIQDDVLVCADGTRVRVMAADEAVSDVSGRDALSLMRAAYHLGNRHVPLQVTADWLRYQRDHVLDDMVRGLGLDVQHREAPFQPENGAYAASSGHHHHEHHHHDHEHGHE